MAKKILITGGAGYIGSHTALELLNEGYEVVVYDNLCNSSKESLKRVEELTGKTITFYEGDVMDEAALKAMLEKEGVDAVIHCAALKAVGESVQKPLEYYRNNIWHQIIRNSLWIFSDTSAFMRSDRVEITKQDDIHIRICLLYICHDLFHHRLCPSIRIRALSLRTLLCDRHLFRTSVYSCRRTEYNILNTGLFHNIHQCQSSCYIITVVL